MIAEYILASGVAAVCIVDRTVDQRGGQGFDLIVLRDIRRFAMQNVVSAYWLPKLKIAQRLCSFVRRTNQDRSLTGYQHALLRAAMHRHVRLVPHAVVIERATLASARFEAAWQLLNQGRRLQNFHAEYRKRRLAARQQGLPMMSFRMAQGRLRRALINRLIEQTSYTEQSLFKEVFNGSPCQNVDQGHHRRGRKNQTRDRTAVAGPDAA